MTAYAVLRASERKLAEARERSRVVTGLLADLGRLYVHLPRVGKEQP